MSLWRLSVPLFSGTFFFVYLALMYRYYILFIIAALVTGKAFGAYQEIFTLDTVYRIEGSLACNKLRIIDMRKEKSNIGHTWGGTFGSKVVDIVTKTPLPNVITGHFDEMVQGNAGSDEELMIVLYRFSLEVRPDYFELGTFYIDADFYRGKQGSYKLLGKVDSMFEVRVKASKSVKDGLFMVCGHKTNQLLQYYSSLLPPDNVAEHLDRQLVEYRKQEKHKYPIYTAAKFKRGIYYTVDQFINHTPVDTPFTTVNLITRSGDKQRMYRYLNTKGKKGDRVKEDSFFAIYDGENWSIGIEFYCQPMHLIDGEFYTIKPFDAKARRHFYPYWVGLSTGFIAGAAVGAIGGIFEGTYYKYEYYECKFNPALKDFVPVKRVQ
jgi:hypothetical protein